MQKAEVSRQITRVDPKIDVVENTPMISSPKTEILTEQGEADSSRNLRGDVEVAKDMVSESLQTSDDQGEHEDVGKLRVRKRKTTKNFKCTDCRAAGRKCWQFQREKTYKQHLLSKIHAKGFRYECTKCQWKSNRVASADLHHQQLHRKHDFTDCFKT